MELSVSHQVYVFAAMILCGALTGVVFDVFRAARRCFHPRSGIIAAQDIALWLAELVLVFVTIFEVNNAAVRFYEVIGLVLGAALYFMTISEYVILFFCKVMRAAVRAFCFAAKPVKKVFSLLALPIKKTAERTKAKIFGVFNSLFCRAKCRLRSLSASLGRKNV